MGDPERTLQIKYDEISMKTKTVLSCFGGIFATLRFDENSILNTLLGFPPIWDYEPKNAVHADSPGVYTSDIILYSSTIDKIHLKCDFSDGCVVNG